MKKNFRFLYGILMVVMLAIATVGATYAYWVASTKSGSSAVSTESTIYSISMRLTPLYPDFSLYPNFTIIPLNDVDSLKALKNKCIDKYERGACFAYTIHVYDYNEDLDFVSGYMDVSTNNMQNLSYMVLRISDIYEEDRCVKIGEGDMLENYCIAKEVTPILDGSGLSLGDSYEVTGMDSTKFILLIWLTNLQYNQNDIDVGSFKAVVTMQAGNGGEIKGSISSSIKIENMVGDSE